MLQLYRSPLLSSSRVPRLCVHFPASFNGILFLALCDRPPQERRTLLARSCFRFSTDIRFSTNHSRNRNPTKSDKVERNEIERNVPVFVVVIVLVVVVVPSLLSLNRPLADYFGVLDNVLSIHELNWKNKTPGGSRACACVYVYACMCNRERKVAKLGKDRKNCDLSRREAKRLRRSVDRTQYPNGVSCNTKSMTFHYSTRRSRLTGLNLHRPVDDDATSKARNKLLRCIRISSNESYPNVTTRLEIRPLCSRVV